MQPCHIQTKTDMLADEAGNVGLKLNVEKCKLLQIKSRINDAVEVNGQRIQDVDSLSIWEQQFPRRVEARRPSKIE